MSEYDDLVLKNQSGVIDDLDFLMSQGALAELYMEDMQKEGLTPNAENAATWLMSYELNHLYR